MITQTRTTTENLVEQLYTLLALSSQCMAVDEIFQ